MAIATGSQSDLGYMLEDVYGVAQVVDATTPYKAIRRKSAAGLNLTKDSYDSEEVRVDRQLADSRHGIRRAGGDVETEVSAGSFNDLLVALLGYAEVDDSTGNLVKGWYDMTNLTHAVTVGTFQNTDANSGTIGAIGAAHGIKGGDVIAVSGALTGANNRRFQVIQAGTTTLIVTPGPVTDATADAFTIDGFGYRAEVGRVYNSFTIERAFTDILQYQHFTGMRVNSAAFSLPSTGLATITWNFLGKDSSSLQTTPVSTANPYLTYPYTAVSTNSVLAAVNGFISIGAVVLGTVTDLSFTIDNQLGGSEVVGSNVIPESLWGNTQMITGKVTVLFEDQVMYNRFDDETTAALTFRMDGPTVLDEYLSFTFPRCKFNSANIGDAVATGLPLEMEFRALLPAVTAGTLTSQVVISTSDATL